MGKQAAKQVAKRGRGRLPKAKPPEKSREIPPLASIIASMGDGNGRFGRYNLSMLRKAIKEEWYPFTAEDRQSLVDLVRKGKAIAKTVKDIAAILKVQITAEALDVKRTDQLIKIIVDNSEKANGTQVNVQVNINADEQRTRLAAIAERLGVADVLEPIRRSVTTSDS